MSDNNEKPPGISNLAWWGTLTVIAIALIWLAYSLRSQASELLGF